jgi:antitoxin component of MazEF toxin-antitoxin module
MAHYLSLHRKEGSHYLKIALINWSKKMTTNSDAEGGNETKKILVKKSYPNSVNVSPLVRYQALTLENLVSNITLDNRHRELDFGIASGAELL